MPKAAPSFPFYMPQAKRPLHGYERELLQTILEKEAPALLPQVASLEVVGRCGCGHCPIVFFEEHFDEKPYADVASYIGPDAFGGLVAVVPIETEGRISQLDFYSVDGHDPWQHPEPASIGRYE